MAQMTDVSTGAPGALPWYKSLTGNQWRMLDCPANLGWLFDGYETYALILTVRVGDALAARALAISADRRLSPAR